MDISGNRLEDLTEDLQSGIKILSKIADEVIESGALPDHELNADHELNSEELYSSLLLISRVLVKQESDMEKYLSSIDRSIEFVGTASSNQDVLKEQSKIVIDTLKARIPSGQVCASSFMINYSNLCNMANENEDLVEKADSPDSSKAASPLDMEESVMGAVQIVNIFVVVVSAIITILETLPEAKEEITKANSLEAYWGE